MSPAEQSQVDVYRAGDSALLVKFGETLSLETNRQVLALDRRLRKSPVEGVLEIIPTICSVLVSFDPLSICADHLEQILRSLLDDLPDEGRGPFTRWFIPTCYGAGHGPDLAQVADLLNCSEAEAIAQHSAGPQQVLMLGFAPGFCYAGLLPENWNLPRLDVVKSQVPAGSVSVAVRQTVMTSTADPTGWRTIARTPFRNFDAMSEQVVLIGAGDEIVFDPVEHADFSKLTNLVEKGRSIVRAECFE